jgi:hypothetical protein
MARLIAYFLLFTQISCLYNSQIKNTVILENTPPAKWCTENIYVTSSNTIPEDKLDAIDNAIGYWNISLVKVLLINIQRLMLATDRSSIIFLTMPEDIAQVNKSAAAVTFVKWIQPNCIEHVTIYIKETTYNLENNVFESIIRHEIGHAMGLQDTNNFEDLMFHTADNLKKHPSDLSEEEINYLKRLYK